MNVQSKVYPSLCTPKEFNAKGLGLRTNIDSPSLYLPAIKLMSSLPTGLAADTSCPQPKRELLE